MFVGRDEFHQGVHSLLCVITLGPYDYLIPLLGPEGHKLERTLRVNLALALDYYDLRGELLRRLDELRRWTSMKTLFGADPSLSLP
jgi:hypothetical protein